MVDILRPDIAINKDKSKASTGANTPISPEMIPTTGTWFTGDEKCKYLADIYNIHMKSIEHGMYIFLDVVEISKLQLLSTYLLPNNFRDQAKLFYMGW